MFQGASRFNQPIHNWNLSKLVQINRNYLVFFAGALALTIKIYHAWMSHIFQIRNQPWRFSTSSQLIASKKPKWGRSVPSSCNAAPTLSSSTPADDATDVSSTANIILTFDENVDVESGNITIKKTSDDSTFETIDVTSNKVTGTGTNVIEINPANTFASSTEYYILIDATAFDDANGNSYAGISSTTALSFTSQDTGNPYLTSTVPAHKATAVAVDANIVLNFSESVDSESGNIVIKK